MLAFYVSANQASVKSCASHIDISAIPCHVAFTSHAFEVKNLMGCGSDGASVTAG